MAPTSAVHHPLQTMIRQGTAKVYSHKTALPCVPLIFVSHIFCPVGRDPHMTLRFSMTPVKPIFTFQVEGITLQTLALPHQMRCLSLIEACGTIYLSGIRPRKRELFIFSQFLTDVLQVHATLRSCSTCVTRQLVMSSSGSLGSSSGIFKYFSFRRSMT